MSCVCRVPLLPAQTVQQVHLHISSKCHSQVLLRSHSHAWKLKAFSLKHRRKKIPVVRASNVDVPSRLLSDSQSLSTGTAPSWVLDAVEDQPWRGGLEPCGEQSYEVHQTLISGTIPEDLAGTAYLCGPGRIRVGDNKYGHWFDGDGMVYSLRLTPGSQPQFNSKWVKTERLVAQEIEGSEKIAMRGAWTNAGGGTLSNLSFPSNPSNTSVIKFAGKILSLCEGGTPIEVDPDTLETVGPAAFQIESFFSAHPKVDPVTGELFNMGLEMSLSRPFGLKLFAMSPDGEVLRQNAVSLGRSSLVHDLALSENHVVVVVPPYTAAPTSLLPFIVGLEAFGNLFQYDASRGTRIIVARRDSLAIVLDNTMEAFSTYHFANAFEEEGRLHVLVSILDGPRESLENNFKDMYNARWQRENLNSLWELVWDMNNWRLLYQRPALSPPPGKGDPVLGMEFAHISKAMVGHKNRYVYTAATDIATVPPKGSYINCLQKYDLQEGTAVTHRMKAGMHPNEPYFVLREGAQAEDDGYIITFAYNAADHATDVLIIDAQKFAEPPLATIRLRTHVPYYFHGCWVPA